MKGSVKCFMVPLSWFNMKLFHKNPLIKALFCYLDIYIVPAGYFVVLQHKTFKSKTKKLNFIDWKILFCMIFQSNLVVGLFVLYSKCTLMCTRTEGHVQSLNHWNKNKKHFKCTEVLEFRTNLLPLLIHWKPDITVC